MTQEEKELLLKDLCTRLPYNVMVRVEVNDVFIKPIDEVATTSTINMLEYSQEFRITPYLRPMSSMTEEEKKIYKTKQTVIFDFKNIKHYIDNYNSLDYLNSIHIDYRGLIPRGLALEAPEDMYK